MSATVDFELTRDEYPDLFDGVETDHAILVVDADGYRMQGKTSGPYGTGYPPEGDWHVEDEWIEGTDEIDPAEASEQVASKSRAMREGGELPDELKAVCENGTPQWELLVSAGEQLELEVV